MSIRPLLALAAMAFAVAPSYAQSACEKLAAAHLPFITITLATEHPGGPFAMPNANPGAAPVTLPAFCRVAGIVGKELRFEVWMPAVWNSKLVSVGNGGLAGAISYSAMVKPLREGYATSSTDTGHTNGPDGPGTWALGHYDRIVNFADLGTHLLAEASKVIIGAFYGGKPEHSYFNGCSQGGHEALIEAQRHPEDYDGIVAGDPANYWTHHYVGGHLWSGIATEGDAYIPASKVPIIADAVNNACDMLDGVKDGVLSDPRRCHFDPKKLLCAGADTTECLTAPQVSAVEKLWAGVKTADGRQVWPGLMPGGEAGPGGWANWITGAGPDLGGHLRLGIPFFRFFVFDDPSWDYRTFRFERSDGFDSDIEYLDSKLGALLNAIDPDLSAFRARGGKMIQYHGWSDPDITPLNSVNYYESALKTMGPDTQEFYRLFMVPGMQHCSGGPGATTFDMLAALDDWKTKGIPPDTVTASKVTNGVVTRTRPLCPYPKEAQWKGSGSTDSAENFECAAPDPPVK
jgi:feruloyl esterase